MKLTVIVPAFNEEAYLAPTLGSIGAVRHAAGQIGDEDQVAVSVSGGERRDVGGAVFKSPGARASARAAGRQRIEWVRPGAGAAGPVAVAGFEGRTRR